MSLSEGLIDTIVRERDLLKRKGVIVKRNYGEYPEIPDDINVKVGSLIIEISVPFGHSADDINIRYTDGNGWNDC